MSYRLTTYPPYVSNFITGEVVTALLKQEPYSCAALTITDHKTQQVIHVVLQLTINNEIRGYGFLDLQERDRFLGDYRYIYNVVKLNYALMM